MALPPLPNGGLSREGVRPLRGAESLWQESPPEQVLFPLGRGAGSMRSFGGFGRTAGGRRLVVGPTSRRPPAVRQDCQIRARELRGTCADWGRCREPPGVRRMIRFVAFRGGGC